MQLNLDSFTRWTVVHEFAHAWDAHQEWALSTGLEEATGGFTSRGKAWFKKTFGQCESASEPGCNTAGYFYGGTPAKGSDASFTRKEDFAESVATYVLSVNISFLHSQFPNNKEFWYTDFTLNPRWDYVNGLMTAP